MKITKQQLKKIIKEELSELSRPGTWDNPITGDDIEIMAAGDPLRVMAGPYHGSDAEDILEKLRDVLEDVEMHLDSGAGPGSHIARALDELGDLTFVMKALLGTRTSYPKPIRNKAP